jgi:hypothetical protein
MLVDYLAYMMSIAKLMDCTPQVPRWNPMDMVKYWTFPMWPCFFRTQGVGAKPNAAKAVLEKFGTWDGLPPQPLLFVQVLCTFVMSVLNFVSFCITWFSVRVVGQKCKEGKDRALPRLYKWRMSKAHFLYHNSLTLDDFKSVLLQWEVASLLTCYMLVDGVKKSFVHVGSLIRMIASVPKSLKSKEI